MPPPMYWLMAEVLASASVSLCSPTSEGRLTIMASGFTCQSRLIQVLRIFCLKVFTARSPLGLMSLPLRCELAMPMDPPKCPPQTEM
jgi:hypothetical protein